MRKGTYLFALPITYAGLLPDNWFSHFRFQNEDKEDIISEFGNCSYIVVYLSSIGKCEVYFGNTNITDNVATIYHDPDEIKEAVFNTLLEYT